MRRSLAAITLLALSASPALAAAADGPVNLLEPHTGLIFWTIVIFISTMLILRKFAWGPILGAVQSRCSGTRRYAQSWLVPENVRHRKLYSPEFVV